MSKRRRSREVALSLIYQMEIKEDWTIAEKTEIIKKLAKGDGYISDYTIKIIESVINNKVRIDDLIANNSQNWSFDRISIIDKSILRMAISELFMSTPKTAVINEAIEIADKYGEKDSKSFINGILDTIAFNL